MESTCAAIIVTNEKKLKDIRKVCAYYLKSGLLVTFRHHSRLEAAQYDYLQQCHTANGIATMMLYDCIES